MKDLIIILFIVAIVIFGYYYAYPFFTLSYDYAKTVCEDNIETEDVFGVLARYRVATGENWKGDILTGSYISNESSPGTDNNILKGTFDTREAAVEHCILYFKKFNRE